MYSSWKYKAIGEEGDHILNITCEGKHYLGSAIACIGTTSFIDAYVQSKVTQWVEEIDNLPTIATLILKMPMLLLHMALLKRYFQRYSWKQ